MNRAANRRRRIVPWLVGLAATATVLASCTASSGSAPATSVATSSPPGTTSGSTLTNANARWTPLGAAPLPNRSSFTTVWTGTELFVCCGTEKLSGSTDGTSQDGDGPGKAAAYNPTTNTWRPVAGPPKAVENWGAITVADKTVYFLDGGTAPWTYAAYDITRDSWREVPAPPVNDKRGAGSRLGPSAWTGKEIVAPITTPPANENDLMMVAFDPSSNTWRTLTPPPTRLEPTSLMYDNGKLTLLGELRNPADQGSALVSETFDTATNTWADPERTPVERRGPQVEGGGDHVVAWDVSGSVRVKTDGQWRDLPPIPYPEDECGWKGTQVGQKLVLWRCTQQGAILDLTTGTWSALPKPPEEILDSNIVVVNGRLMLWASTTSQLQPYALELG